MITNALLVGDEVIDNEENEYMVVVSTPHEVVLHLRPPYENGVWVLYIFQREASTGYWFDREQPDLVLVDQLN